MRIIAGKARGRVLAAPSSSKTRPITDKVRAAIFSILESLETDWSRVLDLYAGSGAVGLEALSRGALWADFVDYDHRCCAVIRRNLDATGFSSQARVYCCKTSRALSFLNGKYSIVFFDPPYAETSLSSLLMDVATSSLVGENTTVVVSHSTRLSVGDSYGELFRVKARRYGDTSISVYQEEVIS